MVNFISRVFVISLLFSFVYAQDASGIKKGADNDAKKPNTSKVSKEKGSDGGKLTPGGNSARMSNTAAPAPKKGKKGKRGLLGRIFGRSSKSKSSNAANAGSANRPAGGGEKSDGKRPQDSETDHRDKP